MSVATWRHWDKDHIEIQVRTRQSLRRRSKKLVWQSMSFSSVYFMAQFASGSTSVFVHNKAFIKVPPF